MELEELYSKRNSICESTSSFFGGWAEGTVFTFNSVKSTIRSYNQQSDEVDEAPGPFQDSDDVDKLKDRKNGVFVRLREWMDKENGRWKGIDGPVDENRLAKFFEEQGHAHGRKRWKGKRTEVKALLSYKNNQQQDHRQNGCLLETGEDHSGNDVDQVETELGQKEIVDSTEEIEGKQAIEQVKAVEEDKDESESTTVESAPSTPHAPLARTFISFKELISFSKSGKRSKKASPVSNRKAGSGCHANQEALSQYGRLKGNWEARKTPDVVRNTGNTFCVNDAQCKQHALSGQQKTTSRTRVVDNSCTESNNEESRTDKDTNEMMIKGRLLKVYGGCVCVVNSNAMQEAMIISDKGSLKVLQNRPDSAAGEYPRLTMHEEEVLPKQRNMSSNTFQSFRFATQPGACTTVNEGIKDLTSSCKVSGDGSVPVDRLQHGNASPDISNGSRGKHMETAGRRCAHHVDRAHACEACAGQSKKGSITKQANDASKEIPCKNTKHRFKYRTGNNMHMTTYRALFGKKAVYDPGVVKEPQAQNGLRKKVKKRKQHIVEQEEKFGDNRLTNNVGASDFSKRPLKSSGGLGVKSDDERASANIPSPRLVKHGKGGSCSKEGIFPMDGGVQYADSSGIDDMKTLKGASDCSEILQAPSVKRCKIPTEASCSESLGSNTACALIVPSPQQQEAESGHEEDLSIQTSEENMLAFAKDAIDKSLYTNLDCLKSKKEAYEQTVPEAEIRSNPGRCEPELKVYTIRRPYKQISMDSESVRIHPKLEEMFPELKYELPADDSHAQKPERIVPDLVEAPLDEGQEYSFQAEEVSVIQDVTDVSCYGGQTRDIKVVQRGSKPQAVFCASSEDDQEQSIPLLGHIPRDTPYRDSSVYFNSEDGLDGNGSVRNFLFSHHSKATEFSQKANPPSFEQYGRRAMQDEISWFPKKSNEAVDVLNNWHTKWSFTESSANVNTMHYGMDERDNNVYAPDEKTGFEHRKRYIPFDGIADREIQQTTRKNFIPNLHEADINHQSLENSHPAYAHYMLAESGSRATWRNNSSFSFQRCYSAPQASISSDTRFKPRSGFTDYHQQGCPSGDENVFLERFSQVPSRPSQQYQPPYFGMENAQYTPPPHQFVQQPTPRRDLHFNGNIQHEQFHMKAPNDPAIFYQYAKRDPCASFNAPNCPVAYQHPIPDPWACISQGRSQLMSPPFQNYALRATSKGLQSRDCSFGMNALMPCHELPLEGEAYSHPLDSEDGALRSPSQNSATSSLHWLTEEEAEIILRIRLTVGQSPPGRLRSPRNPVQASDLPSIESPRNPFHAVPIQGLEHAVPFIQVPEAPFSRRSTPPHQPNRPWKSPKPPPQKTTVVIDLQSQVAEACKRNSAASNFQQCWQEYTTRKERSVAERQEEVSSSLPQHRAATKIQEAWREYVRRQEQQPPNELPKNMKSLYNIIKKRELNKGLEPPTYKRFQKLVCRVRAATEGARVRRRLTSRRLQSMVKEIKEICLFLMEASKESAPETSPRLLAQLSNQLQQKRLQLDTALNCIFYTALCFQTLVQEWQQSFCSRDVQQLPSCRTRAERQKKARDMGMDFQIVSASKFTQQCTVSTKVGCKHRYNILTK